MTCLHLTVFKKYKRKLRNFGQRLLFLKTICAIANPHAKVFDPQHPWGMTPATEWKVCSIWFLSFLCENTHVVWYKNLWNWHGNQNLMIFDLLTSPQGQQFYPRRQNTCILFCFSSPLIWYAKWPCLIFPLCTPRAPKSHHCGMTQANEWKFRLICFVSFIFENTHNVWHKNLWNWFCNWN